MKMKRNLDSMMQRDPMTALQNSGIVGVVLFMGFYTSLVIAGLMIMSFILKAGFHGNAKECFTALFSSFFSSHFLAEKLNVQYDFESINNYFSQYVFYTNIINYTSLLISFVVVLSMTKTEYTNMMSNEKHVSGAEFYDNVYIAKKAFNSNMQDIIKKYSITRKVDKSLARGFKIGDVHISRDQETKHIVVMGKTGGGKTVALWPIILACIARGEKVIIHCNKGDFTAKLLDMCGQMPILSAPWDSRGWAWDVAKDITTEADAAELAAKLIKESGGDPMWGEGARQILTGLLKHLQAKYKDQWTFKDLAHLLGQSTEDISKIVTDIHPEARRVVELEVDEKGNKSAGKTVQSLMITMSAQMSSVFRLAMAYEKAENLFSIRDFLDDKLPSKVLILQSNERYRSLAEAINQSLISCLNLYVNSATYAERPPHKEGVRLILDEFPQLGKVQAIFPLLEVGRSKNVGVILASQDSAQYETLYGKPSADTLLAIPQTFIYCTLGSNAAKFASDSAGQCVVERYSFNIGGDGRRSENWQRSVEPVAAPDAFYNDLGLKSNGTNAVVQLAGGDVYKLLFPFTSVPEQRPGVVPADWTVAEWRKEQLEAIEFEKEDGLVKDEEYQLRVLTLTLLADDDALVNLESKQEILRNSIDLSEIDNNDLDDMLPPL